MKNTYVLFIILIISTQLFSMNYGEYKCTVQEIVSLNGTNLEKFGVSPGKIKKTNDEYVYLIKYDKNVLEFKNIGNGAETSFKFINEINNFKVYKGRWHQFKTSKNDNNFIFGVYKPNYHADYIGKCQKQDINYVENLKALISKNDIIGLSNLVAYPLMREAPIEEIKNKNEFLYRYHEVFDEELINEILQSTKEDWSIVGAKGIMLNNGILWLSTDGNIIGINYQSIAEKIIMSHYINMQKGVLHKSIANFEKPILAWKTKKFFIRIDELKGQKYRYSAWSNSQGYNTKPDIILSDGKLVFDGSAGNYYYIFKNGKYKYKLNVVVLAESTTDYRSLEVYKNDKLILTESIQKEFYAR